LPGQRDHRPALDPTRLEPQSWITLLGRRNKVIQRHPIGMGESEQQLQGRRCPVSSRDNVLFEIPVEAETPVRVSPRWVRSPFRRGPICSRAVAILVAGISSTRLI